MKNQIYFFTFSLFLIIFFLSDTAFAHTIALDLERSSNGEIGFFYFKMGMKHIIPLGYDHILFILGIFILKPNLKAVIKQATAFTLAHSITLGLAIYGYIKPASSIIEPVIALSIVFIGIENTIIKEVKWWRLIIIFLFGLIHGCGFAGVLAETGLPEKDFLLSLISFNVGVEAGQVAVILIAYFVFVRWFVEKSWYRNRITIPASLGISAIAFYWSIERIFS